MRRKLERFALEVPAKIKVVGSDGTAGMLELETINVCSGGAFFRTMHALPEGSKVTADLLLPYDRLRVTISYASVMVRVTGTVVRSESTGMAVCFDGDYQIIPLTDQGAWTKINDNVQFLQ